MKGESRAGSMPIPSSRSMAAGHLSAHHLPSSLGLAGRAGDGPSDGRTPVEGDEREEG